MKNTKKILALVLCLAMCVSLFTGFAMAEEKDTVKLVCIGDSTSNGFGLNDYGKLSDASWSGKSASEDSFGFLDYASKESYPYVLAQHLESKGYAVDVKNLSLEGMRSDELRGILDPAWGAKVPATKGEAGDGHYEKHMEWYNKFFSTNAKYFGTADITEYFTEALKAADVITLDLTMNNFGVYLSNRFLTLTGAKGECGYADKYSETVEDIADELDINVASIENTVKELIAKVLPADAGIPTELVNGLIDTLVYCYCDFRVNLQKDVQLIQTLNPDAKLIVVGAYNFMNGLKSTFNGIDVDFGSLWGTVTGLINSFLTNTCKGADKYYYADCSKGLEMYIDNIAMAETPDDIYENYKTRLLVDALGKDYDDTMKALNDGKAQLDAIEAGLGEALPAFDAAFEAYKVSACDDAAAAAALQTVIGAITAAAGADAANGLVLQLANTAFDTQVAELVAEGIPAATAEVAVASELSGGKITSKSALLRVPDAVNALAVGFVKAYFDGKLTYVDGIGQINDVLSTFIKAAAYTPLDIAGIFGTLGAGGDLTELGAKAIGDWDNATPAEKSVAHVYVRFMAGHGLGAHPDDVGCAQKAEAVIAAYEKSNTAKDDGQGAISDMGKNIFSAAWATLKTPVLDAIKGVFTSFANTIQNIINAIFQPVVDLFNNLPAC